MVSTDVQRQPLASLRGGPRAVRAEGYRPDIDGLRAVAVMSVVLYHFDSRWVPGGFVGVDIFFVISGFLITRNIWREMGEGRFSLADFYLRRIRRIAPAFIATIAATLAAGAFLMLPEDLESLAKSAAWSVASLSNVYFWRHLDTGYFAEAASELPLLHTWSLGVEEQFYFLWPALLLATAAWRGRGRGRAAALILAGGVCVLSFALAERTAVSAPKFAYYMLPARAGELMVGALLALVDARGGMGRPRRILAECSGLLGLVLLGASFVLLKNGSRFPGINAIYPCVGAALVMFGGGTGSRLVRGTLSNVPMVAVGLVSYSLYLWHWPVLAFTRYLYGAVDGVRLWAAAGVIVLLSVLSYRYVETPARRLRSGRMRQAIVLYVAPGAVLLLAAVAIWKTNGLAPLIDGRAEDGGTVSALRRQTAPAYEFPGNCQLSDFDASILTQRRCVTPAAAGEPGLLLWGDSQAAHYIGVLGQLAKAGGFGFRNATHSACPPVFDGDYGVEPYRAGCERFRPYILDALESRRFSTVAMSGAWSTYAALPGFWTDLEHALDRITAAGVQVVLIGQMPSFPAYNRACEMRGARIGGVGCRARTSLPDTGPSPTDRLLAELAASREGVNFVSPRTLVCQRGICSPYVDKQPVYFDQTHLSMEGSWLLGTKLLASPELPTWTAVFNRRAAAQAPQAGQKKRDTADQK